MVGCKVGNWDLFRGFGDDYPVISCDPCRGVYLLLALTRPLLLPLSLFSRRKAELESSQAGRRHNPTLHRTASRIKRRRPR
jgi:hypothetical protein